MLDQAQRCGAAPRLVALAREATQAADALLAEATAAVRQRVTVDGCVVDGLLDREQRATHGLAWLATYVESVRQLAAYAERMHARGGLTLTGKAPSAVEFVSVDAVSRRGRISGTLLVEIAKRPDTTLRYRVLEAGFREQTVAERSEGLNLCRSIGLPIGGRAIFAGASTGASDAEGTVRPSARSTVPSRYE